MKRAVSISIGSSTRDKAVEIELLGETVRLERIGTDGDMEKKLPVYTVTWMGKWMPLALAGPSWA